MRVLCERDCTGDPVIDGKKVHFFYRRGHVYEINPKDSWAIHFRPVTEEEVAALQERAQLQPPPKYLEPVKTDLQDQDDPFKHFNLKF